MEWDQAKIDAAVSTLTEALGTICDVAVLFSHETEELDPFYDDDGQGWRTYDLKKGGQKTIITITPREES